MNSAQPFEINELYKNIIESISKIEEFIALLKSISKYRSLAEKEVDILQNLTDWIAMGNTYSIYLYRLQQNNDCNDESLEVINIIKEFIEIYKSIDFETEIMAMKIELNKYGIFIPKKKSNGEQKLFQKKTS